MSLKKLLALTIPLIFFFFGISKAEENVQIHITTTPEADQIKPDLDVANINVRISDKDGNPVKEGQLTLKIDSPEVNSFFSTDFPIVEGTQLMNFKGNFKNGQFSMSYLFPIRGKYNLRAEVQSLDGSFEPVKKSFQFTLNEVPAEKTNFFIFLAILVIFGGISGVVLGHSAKKKYLEGESDDNK